MIICVIVYITKFNNNKVPEKDPLIGTSYNLEYKGKIFPNMTDSEIDEVFDKIITIAHKKAKEGEEIKVTEEELRELGITGLNPDYLDMIEIHIIK
jgi:hypothetical protein